MSLQGRLAELWNQVRPLMLNRLAVLDQASATALEGSLPNALRLQAKKEAHKLAGSLGIFGLAAGSRMARELEQRLQRGDALSEAEARRLSELTAALRLEVELGQPPEQGF
jgi:HPt (histidine-containing phosphotransfer) domain-containing protein